MKKTRGKKSKRRLIVFGITSIAIILTICYNIVGVVFQIIDKKEEQKVLENQLVLLQNEEEKLNNEILKLQDSDYLARYAREKYFYSKSNELIIRLPNNKEGE